MRCFSHPKGLKRMIQHVKISQQTNNSENRSESQWKLITNSSDLRGNIKSDFRILEVPQAVSISKTFLRTSNSHQIPSQTRANSIKICKLSFEKKRRNSTQNDSSRPVTDHSRSIKSNFLFIQCDSNYRDKGCAFNKSYLQVKLTTSSKLSLQHQDTKKILQNYKTTQRIVYLEQLQQKRELQRRLRPQKKVIQVSKIVVVASPQNKQKGQNKLYRPWSSRSQKSNLSP